MNRLKKRLATVSFASVLMLGLCGQALAATVTFYYEGSIDFINTGGAFDGIGVSVGDTFSGTYTFRTDIPDSDPSAEFGQYNFTSLAPTGMTFILNIGTLSVSTDPANPNSGIRILAFPTFDEYRVNTTLPALPGSNGSLFVDIPTNWGGGHITSDVLPLTPPDISIATFNEILINDIDGGQLAGRITLLELQAVPLPAPLLLFASAIAGLAGFRVTGRRNGN